jgi:putative acetyltransferase
VIRPYTDRDLAQVLGVWRRASEIAHSFLSEPFLAAEEQQIADEWMPVADTVVFEVEGVVVGFLALVGSEVGGLFVDPDHQGRGVGRALMDHVRRAHPVLELSVFEANEIGRRFYAAYGFEVVGRHMNEKAGHPELRLRLQDE